MDLHSDSQADPLLENIAETLQRQVPGISAYREVLKQGKAELATRFHNQEEINTLVRAWARLIDEVVSAVWHHHMPEDPESALIAVGGYGRGELHPGSDIDLMILRRSDDNVLDEPISQLLTFFWDIGLEVGHSVRTLNDCVNEAVADITVATNIMESRFLAGDPQLHRQMRELTSAQHIWPSDTFFAAKLAEQQQRHRKFGDTAYNLEPNIKEGPGGLRDIQVIGWVAKRHYGVETMFSLVAQGFLTEEEYGSLMAGQRLLWRIRFALHLLAGRAEDRLLFDYQRTLATSFGYEDDDSNLAVEGFMQHYYRSIMELSRLNEMLLQHFQEAIILHGAVCIPQRINRRFQSCNGYLEVTDEQVFEREPYALLEIFLILCQQPQLQGVRASTIRLLRQQRHAIDGIFRQDLRNRALFMEILRQPQGVTKALRRMNRYGLLAAYLPAFANIVGRMQYDLFHLYTVDEHSLFVIRNLRRFAVAELRHEFPFCHEMIQRVPKPELLYLAGLFHDIAKGRGGDHSVLGTADATEFCKHHLLSDYDTELVVWLVRQHLLMSMTAQRKDISDPEVIQAFAAQMGDRNRLNYLYLLTVADSYATNPGRWSTWKDALLKELHVATSACLERGLDKPEQQQDRIEAHRRLALEELTYHWDLKADQVDALWQHLSPDYFLQNLPEEIARQTATVLLDGNGEMPLVRVVDNAGRGCSEVFIYARDHRRLFSISTSLLDQLGLNILDARLQTTNDGYALNSYLILDGDGHPVPDPIRRQEIIDSLCLGITDPERITLGATRRMPRQLKHFQTPTRIVCSTDNNNQRSLLRLTTGDRPGLLALVGLAFADCHVVLRNAKIATIGEVAEDSFVLTSEQGGTLSDQEKQCLDGALRKHLGQGD